MRDEIEELLKRLSNYKYDKNLYYEIRELDRQEGGLLNLDLIDRDARFIFLNRTGFNGLYRVNSKGHFNVPFGRYKNPEIANSAKLMACHQIMQKTKITQYNFSEVLSKVKLDDFVYLDPPYQPISPTSNFTNYYKKGFGDDEQSELAEFLHYFNGKNIPFLASNASHLLIYELYKGLSITEISARRSINSKSEGRVLIPEILISNL